MSIDTSLLIITVGLFTPCLAIAMRATSTNQRRHDAMFGDRSTRSLEQQLMELSRGHEELAASVDELKQTVQTILLRLK